MPVKIFFCYAREDELLLKSLQLHLRPLQRRGLIDIWHDRGINAGSEWEKEISKNLDEAQIILLMVSPYFMDSEYCYGIELKRAIERHERNEAHVIPVILDYVYWQIEPLNKLQALPTDAKPIMSASWHNLNEALFDVAEGICKVAETLLTGKVKGIQEEAFEKSESIFLGIAVDTLRRQVWVDGQLLHRALTPLEFKLTEYLALHAGIICRREDLLQALYGEEYFARNDQHLDAILTRLRKVLGESAQNLRYLITHRGGGIQLVKGKIIMPE